MKELGKKGASQSIQGLIMGIGGAAVTLVVVLVVIGELKGSTTDTNATKAAGDMQTKLGTVPTWIGLVIIAAFAAIVMAYFYIRG